MIALGKDQRALASWGAAQGILVTTFIGRVESPVYRRNMPRPKQSLEPSHVTQGYAEARGTPLACALGYRSAIPSGFIVGKSHSE